MLGFIERFPVLHDFLCGMRSRGIIFPGSKHYWIRRYRAGGSSGPGSYDKFAQFKAEVLNEFVQKRGISSVIEYGCGDGNQLSLARYPQYLGFDISPRAVELCRRQFAEDPTKSFKLMAEYDGERAELTLSLDVIYHLVEDTVFESYMHRLFDSSDRFVIIYSSNHDNNSVFQSSHVLHRRFTDWVAEHCGAWEMIDHIPNRYPKSRMPMRGSFADFFVYRQKGQSG